MLMLAYATQAAVVALQAYVSDSPSDVTSAYSYPPFMNEVQNNMIMRYANTISILSFLYQAAAIFMNVCIIGAIWIYANHAQTNGTTILKPGILSWAWNAFWVLSLIALGYASWGVAMARRGTSSYPALVDSHYNTRTLYVVYVVLVIVASTSATLEAILCWIGTRKHAIPGNHFRTTLSRTVPLFTPIVWVRNCFLVAQIVIIYYNERNWSRMTNQALAFLFIIFGELSDLAILAILLFGAWSFGRNNDVAEVVKEARPSDSEADDVRGPTYVPHVN